MVKIITVPDCCKQKISLLDLLREEENCTGDAQFAKMVEKFYHEDNECNFRKAKEFTLSVCYSRDTLSIQVVAFDATGDPINMFIFSYDDYDPDVTKNIFGTGLLLFLKTSRVPVVFDLIWPTIDK